MEIFCLCFNDTCIPIICQYQKHLFPKKLTPFSIKIAHFSFLPYTFFVRFSLIHAFFL